MVNSNDFEITLGVATNISIDRVDNKYTAPWLANQAKNQMKGQKSKLFVVF
jgi:hypothetical protein